MLHRNVYPRALTMYSKERKYIAQVKNKPRQSLSISWFVYAKLSGHIFMYLQQRIKGNCQKHDGAT